MTALWANLAAEPVMMQIPLSSAARAAASLKTRSDLATGSVAPAFELRDAEGRSRRLTDWRGRYVLLYFTNDCTKCSLSSAPDWDTLAAKRRDVALAVIAPVKAAELLKVKKEVGYQAAFLSSDGSDVTQNYQVAFMPRLYVLDKAGRVLYAQPFGATPEQVKRQVEPLLDGRKTVGRKP